MSATSVAALVLTSVARKEDAEKFARLLIERNLAACVSILPAVRSFYRWHGKFEDQEEILLLVKTNTERLPALEAAFGELHPYELPEFLVLEAGASARYAAWLASPEGTEATET